MLAMNQQTDSRDLWFVVQAKPRKESLAEFHLKRQQFRTFYPHYRIAGWEPRPDSKYLADFIPKRAYLTGYLFVQSVLERLAPVYSTIGVSTVVGSGAPFAIPERLIDKLKELTKPDGEMIGEAKRPIDEFTGQPGDAIKVTGESNSLLGFHGVIHKVCPKHIVAELDKALFGQRIVSISKDDVEIVRAMR